MKRRLLWQIFYPLALISTFSVALIVGYAIFRYQDAFGPLSTYRLASLAVDVTLFGVAVIAVSTFLILIFSGRLSEPLEDINRAVEAYTHGDFSFRIPIVGYRQMASLASQLNTMATAIDRKLDEASSQQSEQNAVLLNMAEGVFAVDSKEHILSINKAAAELFGGDVVLALGRSLPEVIRNPDLQKFVTLTLQSESPVEGDIILHQNSLTHYVQAHGTQLKNLSGENVGAVVVLNNVTRLRKLENLRRDFVANVSHEIKTPITSIKGFVETLLDGALDNADDARHFLKIIAKHTDRLNSIIDDLLELSRLEENAERLELDLLPQEIKPILITAIETCATKSQKKNIQVTLSCPEGLLASVNARLLEQALINLIDNAIKYSEPDHTVEVRAEVHEENLILEIKDHGMGIEPQHLDRLFERFYRVDKARSRDQGGTGLGLAIVKHIAQAHGGEVHVESILEKGSVFKILLPIRTI